MLEAQPEADAVAYYTERQPLLSPDPLTVGAQKDDSLGEAVLPRERIGLRVFAAMLSFFVMGIHTAAVGVLIPYASTPFLSDDVSASTGVLHCRITAHRVYMVVSNRETAGQHS
jgi:hypothetical protein